MKQFKLWEFLVVIAELILLYLFISKGAKVFYYNLEHSSFSGDKLSSIFLIDSIVDSVKAFYFKLINIKVNGFKTFFEKIFLITKAIVLFFITLRIVYILIIQNTRENTIPLILMHLTKMLLTFIFLFSGIAIVLANIQSEQLFEFGKITHTMPLKNFLESKILIMVIIFGMSAYDVFKYHNSGARKSSPPPPEE